MPHLLSPVAAQALSGCAGLFLVSLITLVLCVGYRPFLEFIAADSPSEPDAIPYEHDPIGKVAVLMTSRFEQNIPQMTMTATGGMISALGYAAIVIFYSLH